jgi:hypothetical protein
MDVNRAGLLGHVPLVASSGSTVTNSCAGALNHLSAGVVCGNDDGDIKSELMSRVSVASRHCRSTHDASGTGFFGGQTGRTHAARFE